MSLGSFDSPHNNAVSAEQCYFCPRRSGLETHHIVPQRFGGCDAEVNLVVVCERCHRKLERLYDARFYRELGVRDGDGQRRRHVTCTRAECTAPARIKVGRSQGLAVWFCREHAEEPLAEGANVLERRQEVEV